MAREGGSYYIDKNGDRVLRERTGTVVTTDKPKAKPTTKEVTKHESA